MGLPKDDVAVEIAPGADITADPGTWTWVDLCAPAEGYPHGRVQRPVTITQGRRSEGATSGPSTCSFTVRNEDGALTAANPLGPWYGRLGLGTPLRVTWDGSTRFLGLISELPTTWLGVVDNSRVPVRADGILRRLGQGAPSLGSTLRRHTPTVDDVVAYWPMEDGGESRSCASPIAGVAPLRVHGDVQFASVDGPPGSEQLPRFGPGATFAGSVPPHTPAGAWRCRWLFRMDDDPAELRTAGRFVTASGLEYTTRIDGTDIVLQVRDQDGSLILNVTQARSPLLLGHVAEFSLLAEDDGDDVDVTLTVSRGGVVLNQIVDDVDDQELSYVAKTWMGVLADDISYRMLGHITVVASDADPWSVNGLTAVDGFAGELAADRIERLCGEESIAADVIGTAAESMPMGPQLPGDLVSLLRECERTDGGILYESDAGLAYRVRTNMYNQDAAWDLDFCDLNGAPQATHDDQQTRNDVTAHRPGGSSSRVVDDDHVDRHGRYDESPAANPQAEDLLTLLAAWLVHQGTVEEMRWPLIPVSLNTQTQHLLAPWQALTLGDRITIPHEVPQLPGVDVDLLVHGWTETIHSRRAEITLNCAPASPWRVWQLEHDTFGRVDGSSLRLDSGIDDSDTSMDVAFTGPPAITTADHASQFPFDVVVGGEVMTVTGIGAAAGGVQTWSVTRGVNGISKSHDSGTRVTLHPSYTLAL